MPWHGEGHQLREEMIQAEKKEERRGARQRELSSKRGRGGGGEIRARARESERVNNKDEMRPGNKCPHGHVMCGPTGKRGGT